MDKKSVVEVIDRFITASLENKSETTKKTYRYVLERFHRWLVQNGGNIDHLTRVDIQQYIKWLEANKKSAGTINKIYACSVGFPDL